MTLHERKVLTLPEQGKCVVAHPRDERQAIKKAEELAAPYLLRRIVPVGGLYVLDLDAMPKVGEFWL